MIQVTPQMRILLAVEPADFRKGIDGLAQVCWQVLQKDPFSGYVFIFRNKKASAIKVLMYDGQGPGSAFMEADPVARQESGKKVIFCPCVPIGIVLLSIYEFAIQISGQGYHRG